MNDLRHDQEAADAATHAKLRGKTFVTETTAAARLNPTDLRTVPMPELRSPDARTLDAAARELPPRTYDERMDAEIAALRLAVQELRQAVDDLQQTVMGVRA